MSIVISSVKEMHRLSSELKRANNKIGFVPTMGYLHEGHISLIRASKRKSDATVVSIFVNPIQFAPNEDFNKYPRDFNRDKKMLQSEGVDAIFYPSSSEIYPENFQTYVTVEKISQILEGTFRPAHFKGVTTIVNILFNCVKPDIVFFGQKDAQQAAIIKQMIADLKMDIEISIEPIVREQDGLAMSSRNIYLNEKERRDALVLYNSLCLAEKLINSGERNKERIVTEMQLIINSVESSKIDYIEIVEQTTFSISNTLERGKSYYVLVACWIGTTRLIDNILVTI
ncbi:pantoate--beta-alanine ligase [Melioribacteraceae bacterium 4301-Me]|uniref:pantoate--beta-alanine ligase n=1 Tax=Pyranulibacter aquaticus TaxID=3163344 RepID=UPI0035984B3C